MVIGFRDVVARQICELDICSSHFQVGNKLPLLLPLDNMITKNKNFGAITFGESKLLSTRLCFYGQKSSEH